MKKLTAIIMAFVMLFVCSTVSFAAELSSVEAETIPVIENAPVIGDFVSDPDYDEFVRNRGELAERYVAAKQAGDIDACRAIMNALDGAYAANAKNTQNIVTRAASNRLAIIQKPQETNYWCGYAAMKSLLDYKGVVKTQTQIAQQVYSTSSACPWYLTNGSSYSDFPVSTNLTSLLGRTYTPYPYGQVGTVSIINESVKSRVITSIDEDYGVMGCGRSKASSSDLSHLPNYPTNTNVDHWVAVDGYSNSGYSIHIVDPAKSSAVNFGSNIAAYYAVSLDKFCAFITHRGLIW